MSILIRDGVAILPIRVESIDGLLEENDQALGWKVRDFLERAKAQGVGEGRAETR